MNESALFKLSYGVYVVSALDEANQRATGCIANSLMQITAVPPSVAVSIHHDNYTNQCIRQTGRFAVSILAEQTPPAVIGQFGFRSGREIDKFEQIPCIKKDGIPVLKDAVSFLVCRVTQMAETCTHTVFFGDVVDADLLVADQPVMTYAYYHQVIKGKSPKNAPTYRSDTKAPAPKYKCSVCGYEYQGDTPFEKLPDDYVCPICGVGKEQFVQQ